MLEGVARHKIRRTGANTPNIIMFCLTFIYLLQNVCGSSLRKCIVKLTQCTFCTLHRPSFPFFSFVSISCLYRQEKKYRNVTVFDIVHCLLHTESHCCLTFSPFSASSSYFISFLCFHCRLRSSPLLVCFQTGNYYIMTLIAQPARILNKQSIDRMGNILREKLKLKIMQQGIEVSRDKALK